MPKAVAEQYIADLMKKFQERDKRKVVLVQGYDRRWMFLRKKRRIIVFDDGINMFSKVWKASKMMKKVKSVEHLKWIDAKTKLNIIGTVIEMNFDKDILDISDIPIYRFNDNDGLIYMLRKCTKKV